MRTSILTVAILAGAWTLPAVERVTSLDLTPVATVAAQEPAQQPSSPPSEPSSQPSQSQPTTSEPRSAQPAPSEPVNVQVTNRWHFSPLWTAIGIIGAVLVVMLIVMASKSGGSNTVIRG